VVLLASATVTEAPLVAWEVTEVDSEAATAVVPTAVP
jgi:hypothetical protein